MKSLCQILALMTILTMSFINTKGQELSSVRPGNESYQTRTVEEDYTISQSPPDAVTAESHFEQLQGYSHGIEYKSYNNSLNMMECVATNDPGRLEIAQVYLIKTKYISMAKVLSLSNEEAEAFFPFYARYESALTELAAKTPDPNRLIELHQTLKELFFDEINERSGSYLASRFLAWENYYANTCTIK